MRGIYGDERGKRAGWGGVPLAACLCSSSYAPMSLMRSETVGTLSGSKFSTFAGSMGTQTRPTINKHISCCYYFLFLFFFLFILFLILFYMLSSYQWKGGCKREPSASDRGRGTRQHRDEGR